VEKLKKARHLRTIPKMTNSYVDVLRGKEKDTKTILSPKRQIVKNQKERCYMCEKSLGSAMCYFAEIEGPDMNTGINSKEMRAICATCSFGLGKNPVKQVKKLKDTEREKIKAKEKKAEDEEVNLFKELKLKHNTKDEMYDEWK
jgi:PP-loop superfamily ATP-utilizing enzyme